MNFTITIQTVDRAKTRYRCFISQIIIIIMIMIIITIIIIIIIKIIIKLNEFPENLRCSNINGAMHKLLVGECLTKMLWSVSIKTRTFASVNTCNGSF